MKQDPGLCGSTGSVGGLGPESNRRARICSPLRNPLRHEAPPVADWETGPVNTSREGSGKTASAHSPASWSHRPAAPCAAPTHPRARGASGGSWRILYDRISNPERDHPETEIGRKPMKTQEHQHRQPIDT